MSALPLARLETQPIAIPTYRNERIRSFADWFRDNDKVITAYYNAIRPYCEGEPLVDYWTFVALQHEREELRLYESVAGTPSGAVLTCRLPVKPAGSFLRQVLGTLEVTDERLPHGDSL